MKSKGVFTNGLIWFGAAISIAEIEAGIQCGSNWAPLILGHFLGGLMLFAMGILGAKSKKNAMETVKDGFGNVGSKIFASLNFLQLVGWTSVMITQAAAVLDQLGNPFSLSLTYSLIGLFVLLWIFVGLQNKAHLGTIGMSILIVLLVYMSYKLFSLSPKNLTSSAGASFWQAFEISIAMPLSFLPLISDYTKNAEKPVTVTLVSALAYTIASLWMYAIGIFISICTDAGICTPEFTSILQISKIGSAGILIVLLSTVTTTFLDVYSAGESAHTIIQKISPKIAGMSTCLLGVLLCLLKFFDYYANFLYLIASVFAPMASVLIVSHYFVKRYHPYWNGFAWFIGFAVYQFAGNSPIGPSISAILVSAFVCGIRALRN